MKRPWELSRRALLGGAGAAIALPFLEAMGPGVRRARAGGKPAARRLLCYFVPNGMHMPAWTPAAEGRDFALPPLLEPLAPLRDQVLVLTGLQNFAATAQGDGAGDHARGTGSFLTATHVAKTEGAGIRNGISLDQAAAAALGGATRFASLELGLEGGDNAGGCDSGYSCAYVRNISWAGPSTPLAKETSPRALFDRLFAGLDPGLTAAEIARRRAYRRSVLDHVARDAARLAGRLGRGDRAKLDEYLTGIREIERRLDAGDAACEAGARPAEADDLPTRLRLMHDLIALAFRCDLTRIVTFMLGNGGSNRTFPHLGVSGAHHELSHHQGDPAKQASLQTIGRWEVEQLAALLGALAAARDADGPLLDSTVALFSSEISDGDWHNHDHLPVLLAGRGGGAFAPGRHVVYRDAPSVANLYVSILRALGVPAERFGDDGTGPLPRLDG